MIQVLTYQLKIPKHVWGHVAPPFEFRSLKNSPSQKGHGLNHLVCWKSSSWILNFSTSDTLKMHKFIPGSDFWRFDRRFNAHLFEQEFFHQQYHWHFWKKKNKKDSVQSPPRGTPHLQKSYGTLVRVYRSFPIKNASLDYASYSDEYVLGLPIFFLGGGGHSLPHLAGNDTVFLHSSRNTLAPASLRIPSLSKKNLHLSRWRSSSCFFVHTVDGSEILHNRRPCKWWDKLLINLLAGFLPCFIYLNLLAGFLNHQKYYHVF